jgi:hypothetical protein
MYYLHYSVLTALLVRSGAAGTGVASRTGQEWPWQAGRSAASCMHCPASGWTGTRDLGANRALAAAPGIGNGSLARPRPWAVAGTVTTTTMLIRPWSLPACPPSLRRLHARTRPDHTVNPAGIDTTAGQGRQALGQPDTVAALRAWSVVLRAS